MPVPVDVFGPALVEIRNLPGLLPDYPIVENENCSYNGSEHYQKSAFVKWSKDTHKSPAKLEMTERNIEACVKNLQG